MRVTDPVVPFPVSHRNLVLFLNKLLVYTFKKEEKKKEITILLEDSEVYNVRYN
jgi:hypothetical protein